jgi:hypothetical protein
MIICRLLLVDIQEISLMVVKFKYLQSLDIQYIYDIWNDMIMIIFDFVDDHYKTSKRKMRV